MYDQFLDQIFVISDQMDIIIAEKNLMLTDANSLR